MQYTPLSIVTEKSARHNTRRSDSECQQTASAPTIILIDRLRVTTTSHQVWRARLFSLVRLHLTDYQKTFARNLTSLTFENFLKLTILIMRLTFNNCILSFYLQCTHGLPVMGALEMLFGYEYMSMYQSWNWVTGSMGHLGHLSRLGHRVTRSSL